MHMLKYFISLICFFLFTRTSYSQEKKKVIEVEKESVSKFYNPKTYGLRLGIDVLKPILSYTRNNFNGVEIIADYRLKTQIYVAAEAGYMDRTIQENNFNFSVNGTYLTTGINYNLYTNWLNMDNEIYVGARYGFSLFDSTLNNYTVFQNGEYFAPKKVNTPTKYVNLNAHWAELVVGIKTEIFKNLFLGFMLSVNKIINTKDGNNFKNTYVPGFGKITKNGSGANMNYTISYRIPLYQK